MHYFRRFSALDAYVAFTASMCNISQGGNIHSFNTGSHVVKLGLCNLKDIKVAQPKFDHMGTSIEGIYSAPVYVTRGS